MHQQYLAAVRQPGQQVNPLFALLGIQLEHATPQSARLRLPFRKELLQGAGVVAGGVLATLADEAMAHLVIANLEPGQKTATVEMAVRYFRPVINTGLAAEAVLVSRGRRILSLEASVTDDQARLVAKAQASFFILEDKLPPPGASQPGQG